MNYQSGNSDLEEKIVAMLPSRSWASYVNNFSAKVDETCRVIKGGGLQQPGVAEHLQASRVSNVQPTSREN